MMNRYNLPKPSTQVNENNTRSIPLLISNANQVILKKRK